MTDRTRKYELQVKLINMLRETWKDCPNQRFGQMLMNALVGDHASDYLPYFVSDEILLTRLKEYQHKLALIARKIKKNDSVV